MSITEITLREDFSPEETERYSGIKRNTLAAWRKAGQGPPYFQHGRIIRYSKRAFDEWMEAQTQRPTTSNGPKISKS